MKQPKLMAITVASFMISSPIAFAEDITINRLLASQCAQCHGTYGRAVGDIDELNGEGYKDMVEDLDDMRGEDFPENIMDHQALGYTQNQIERIARYYASIPEGNGRNSEDEDH